MRGIGALVVLSLTSLALADGPRYRARFDDGWRFRVDPSNGPSGLTSAFAWEWKPAQVPNLNAIGELPTESGWAPARLGENVFGEGGWRYAWFRARATDSEGAKKVLRFEAVDDNAVVFVNGKRLILHEGWNEPFSVMPGAAWKSSGENEILVLVENTGGAGGIHGSVRFEAPKPEVPPFEAEPGFADAHWRSIQVPHDYVVEGKFSPDEDVSHGFLPKPTAWYRKTFRVPKQWKGRKVWLDFDGVYRNATVYVNGKRILNHPSGYIGFQVDLSAVDFSQPVTLAVRTDPRQNEGWWYEGGGIYRHVYLNSADPVHIAPLSTFVRTEVDGSRARIRVRHDIVNGGGAGAEIQVRSEIRDPRNRVVAKLEVSKMVLPAGGGSVEPEIVIGNPQLWSLETPQLYRLVTSLLRNGKEIDREETPFGIRTIRFDRERGFFLNGKPVKLKGTCNHQDHAGVGTAIPDRLQFWRIAKLKEMGSNAYRCSHNPPAPEVLEACDRLGMLVMDETRHLGDATTAKTAANAKADDLSELRTLIRRDRNHPSVIMWSLANEEPLQGQAAGARLFTAMKNVVRELDPTRPVTSAMNGGWESPEGYGPLNDVLGFNYATYIYDRIYQLWPIPMVASETASTVSTRGIYANDPERGYVSAYDLNKPGWGNTAEEAWRAVAEREWMAGAFVWTGFDYKGEPTPYSWPCINSHFGILDIAGFPKDNFWYYQAWWGNKPVAHILPHWNWSEVGKPVAVWVHSNAEEVELTLNGKSLGRKPMPRLGHLEWQVPYTPGALEAIGRTKGRVVARDRVVTAGAPASLRLKSTFRDVLADGSDAALIEVEVLDARGNVVPTAGNRVRFSISGVGQVVGVGNGDPSSHEPDKASTRSAFNGKCMVLVGGTRQRGRLTLTASSPGLRSATLNLPVR